MSLFLLELENKRTLKCDQDLNEACQVLAKTLLKIYQDWRLDSNHDKTSDFSQDVTSLKMDIISAVKEF